MRGVDWLLSFPPEERPQLMLEYIQKEGLTLDDMSRLLALCVVEIVDLRNKIDKMSAF